MVKLWLPIIVSLHMHSALGIFHRWDLVSSRTQDISRGRGLQSLFDYGYSRKTKRTFYQGEEEEGEATVLTECLTVSHSEPGRFSFTSRGEGDICGLYLVARPDQVVRIELESTRLSDNCDQEILVLMDGWELNGNVIPSADDHPLPWKKRFNEVCGSRAERTVLVSHQNAAMIQFKIPTAGHGFNVSVDYLDNPDPCNVLMSDLTGIFQISNKGEERNCSLTTLLFPAKISLLQVNVGARLEKRGLMERVRREYTGIIPQCSEMGERDFLELGGSADLTASNLDTSSTLCGFEPEPAAKGLTILCGSSTVRLVSSGAYRNSVTFLVEAATEQDMDTSNNILITCPH